MDLISGNSMIASIPIVKGDFFTNGKGKAPEGRQAVKDASLKVQQAYRRVRQLEKELAQAKEEEEKYYVQQ